MDHFQIRNQGEVPNDDVLHCLDSEVGEEVQKPVGAYPCHRSGGNQVIYLNIQNHSVMTTLAAERSLIFF